MSVIYFAAMTPGPDVVCAHVKVQGRVQGVFFRAETREAACRENVTGWVRNCPDGSVEACFEGSRAAVDAMIAWCQHGPPAASVEHVESREISPQGLSTFEIRY